MRIAVEPDFYAGFKERLVAEGKGRDASLISILEIGDTFKL